MGNYHTPVLLEESVSAMSLHNGGIFADATFGGGGHSREILKRMGKNSTLLAMDKDPEALANAPEDPRLITVHGNFRFISNFVQFHGLKGVDGIIADLGVSSHQFDTEERGFSFRFDSPLDMRMNRQSENTAADILNSYSDEDLARIFSLYGEVEKSRSVARLICAAREKKEITRTSELNKILAPLMPRHSEHKYLAKYTRPSESM